MGAEAVSVTHRSQANREFGHYGIEILAPNYLRHVIVIISEMVYAHPKN